MTGEWPLVGRSEHVVRATEAVTGHPPRSVLLTGPPGGGKTRVATEVAAATSRARRLVLSVAATQSAAGIPFGALAPLLPPSADDGDPAALLVRVQASIAERAGDRPVVLVVDDVHLLDPGSADLLEGLGRSQVALLLVARDGAALPAGLTRLSDDGLLETIALGPLGRDEVGTLLAAVLDGPVARSTVHQLARRSQGNPLYLRELVRAALDDGTLRAEPAGWTLRATGATSPRLAELVRATLGRLDELSVAAIELLATADGLGEQVLRKLVPDLDVDNLVERGVLARHVDGRRVGLRLAHPLYGEVTRAQLPAMRSRRLRGRLAGALEGVGTRRREDLLRLAVWQLESDRPPSVEVLGAAAREARQRFDLGLAERLARRAWEAGGPSSVGITLGEVAFQTGRPEEAASILAVAAERATTDDDIAGIANTRAHVLFLLRRDAEASAVLREARERLSSPAQRLELAARASMLLVFAGRADEALEAAEHVVDRANPDHEAGRVIVRATARYAAVLALGLLGRLERAVAVADEAFDELQRLVGTAVPPEHSHIGRAVALLLAGHYAEARHFAEAAETALVERGDREGEATGALLRGRALLGLGDAAAARDLFLQAAAVNRELSDEPALRWSLGGALHALALLRDEPGLAAVRAELNGLTGEPAGLFEPELVRRGLGWAAVADGDLRAGRTVLADAADLACELGQRAPELVLRHDLLRLGDTDQVDRLRKLAEHLEGPLAMACTLHAQAVRSRAPDDLAAAAEAFAELGAVVEAAELATAAGRAYGREGLAGRASALARRAEELRAACPGVQTPGLVALAPAGVELTRREREIAELAARGATSREIGERLGLSHRTVENHLQRVYVKLGVANRTELAELLGH